MLLEKVDEPRLSSDVSKAWLEEVRKLALSHLDEEVFNRLRPVAGRVALGQEDLLILAAVLREATRLHIEYTTLGKPEGDIEDLVKSVAALVERAVVPGKIAGDPAFRAYFAASLGWYRVLADTAYVDLFWNTIEALLHRDMSELPDTREQLIGDVADIGRRFPLPPSLQAIVLDFARKPYLVSDPSVFLKVLGYVLHRRIIEADLSAITEVWLGEWRRHLSIGRAWPKARRGAMIALKDDIHTRLSLMFRTSGVLLGRLGGFRATLTLIFIKLDYHLFVKPRLSGTWFGLLWLWFLRNLLRQVGRLSFRLRRAAPQAQEPPEEKARVGRGARRRYRLRLITAPMVRGRRRDLLVTRTQGGLGDVIMMRPGLIRAARKRRGRVVFAGNRAYFSAFSVDDPLDLVDIERSEIDLYSFGRWVNFSAYPEAVVEVREIPKVVTNRIDIFARSLGVPFPPLSRGRVCPIRFADDVAEAGRQVIASHAVPGRLNVGIHLRSAETYRDVPVMLDVARRLAEQHTVFVLDSRPIPRQPGDQFISVDNQKLPVAMAMVGQFDALIGPDSSFLHVAGANGIPCLAIFGPTGGRVRCKPYPSVRYLDAASLLSCLPCWRNERLPCKVTEGFESVCLNAITTDMILEGFDRLMAQARRGFSRFDPRRRIDTVHARPDLAAATAAGRPTP